MLGVKLKVLFLVPFGQFPKSRMHIRNHVEAGQSPDNFRERRPSRHVEDLEEREERRQHFFDQIADFLNKSLVQLYTINFHTNSSSREFPGDFSELVERLQILTDADQDLKKAF
jgi:hypothetical protein